MELTEDEKLLIESLRKDRMLKKAIYKYFESMSGISLTFTNEKDVIIEKNDKGLQDEKHLNTL